MKPFFETVDLYSVRVFVTISQFVFPTDFQLINFNISCFQILWFAHMPWSLVYYSQRNNYFRKPHKPQICAVYPIIHSSCWNSVKCWRYHLWEVLLLAECCTMVQCNIYQAVRWCYATCYMFEISSGYIYNVAVSLVPDTYTRNTWSLFPWWTYFCLCKTWVTEVAESVKYGSSDYKYIYIYIYLNVLQQILCRI